MGGLKKEYRTLLKEVREKVRCTSTEMVPTNVALEAINEAFHLGYITGELTTIGLYKHDTDEGC